MRPARQIISVALVLAISAPIGSAAEDVHTSTVSAYQQSSTPAPTIQVFSRETVVDVTVTDDKGNPVYGLQQSDFTIEENGKPQPIRSFREYGAEPPPPAQPLPALPPGVYTNFQAAPASGPVNILLLDAFHSNFALMVYEKQAILRYLHKMPDGTQVAVFWLAQSGLHLLQGFTSDRALLERAVNNARTDVGNNIDPWTRQWYTIDAFRQLSQYVAGIRGRKNLLWFTPGMPIMLTRDGGYGWADSDMGRVHRLMDAYELLSAQQVAVYPIDPTGPAHIGFAQLRAEEVAEQSGGLALYNSNDIPSLITKAIDHGSRFYTLSYVPPNRKDDGHFHHIKVLVDRPGLHLVYRTGYNAEDPRLHPVQPGIPTMKAAMEGAAPPATQLLFDVQAIQAPTSLTSPIAAPPGGSARRNASARPTVPFDFLFLVPQSQVAFTQTADGLSRGSVEFDVAAYADNRKLAGLVSQTMQLPLTPEEYDDFIKTPFRFSEHLDLPPGQYTMRVGILDSVSKKVGTLEFPLIVQPGGFSMGAVIPPNPTPCPPRCAMPTLSTPSQPPQ